MQRTVPVLALGAMVLMAATAATQTPPVTLAAVAKAMGATNLSTIEYSGTGFTYGFLQSPGPGEPWPMFIVDSYKVSVDYGKPAMKFDWTRSQGEYPPRGGNGQPLAGKPRTVTFVSGKSAWTEAANGRAQPNIGAVSDRLRQLWLTPHGLVKAAMASGAKISNRTMSLQLEGVPIKVRVGANDLVERAEYLIMNPALGDVLIELVYTDYKDFGGVQFPTRILEKTDGYLTWNITVAEVKPNAPVSLNAPADMPVASATPPPAQPLQVEAKQLASGVWYLTASGIASILTEFRDFLVIFDAPTNDARSIAVNEWARKTVPGKPIRYLVNTHAHLDHAGGVREYVSEGVTIITHEMNRSFYEKIWDRPRTLRPDRLALQPRTPIWETMTEKKVVTDGTRSLELHKLYNNGHNPYILIGYLPAEKILMYADMYIPPPGDDPRDPGRTNEFAQNLYDNVVDRLKLDVQMLAPIHGRPVPFDNLKKALGLIPLGQ